jgi:hypothetical protein
MKRRLNTVLQPIGFLIRNRYDLQVGTLFLEMQLRYYTSDLTISARCGIMLL